MVDVTLKEAHEYWSQFPDPSVYKVIVFLESCEQSFYDGDQAYEDAMDKLGDALDLMSTESVEDLSAVLGVLAYTRTSRYLRLLQGMDGVSPGAASKVIQAAERSKTDDKDGQLFLKRNVLFERYRLLQRVLSDERLKELSEALEVA